MTQQSQNSNIENSTITVSKAVVIIVSLCSVIVSLIGGYYSSKQGTRDAINEIKLDVRDVSNRNNLQDILINGNTESIKFQYGLIQVLQDKTEKHDADIIELRMKSTKNYR